MVKDSRIETEKDAYGVSPVVRARRSVGIVSAPAAAPSDTALGKTEVVAQYVAELGYAHLPAEVVEKAKAVILDALGCSLACSTLPLGQAAIDYARRQVGRPVSTLIGTAFKTGAEDAALVNGILGHGDEIDETVLGFGHAAAVLVPAVLAAGEREQATGRDMIVALVIGYDVATRLARAGFSLDVLAPRNWQQASSAGSIAAAAAAGKLLGLNQRQLQIALGLGAEQACGLQTMRTESGHMNKSMHMGVGSRNGVASAYLARSGYGGVLNVFDPPYSVFEAFVPGEGEAKPDELTKALGSRFEILGSSFKRYSAGRPMHTAIAALHEIMEAHELDGADLEEIHVKVPTLEHGLLSRSLTIEVNIEYVVAVAALDRRVTWDQYSEERQRDPVLRDLWHRVTSEGNPEFDALKDANVGSRPSEVTVTTRDGRTITERMIYSPGHPRNPFRPGELGEKFMYWATKAISRAQATELASVVEDLELLPDVNHLGNLLRVS